MATGRPRDGIPPTPAHLKKTEGSYGTQADFSSVVIKMGIFVTALAVLPIASYFISRDYYWKENLTGAGITAATVANILLVGFVAYALTEDDGLADNKQVKKIDAKSQ